MSFFKTRSPGVWGRRQEESPLTVTVQRGSVQEIPTVVVERTIKWDDLPKARTEMLDQVHELLKGTDAGTAGHEVLLYLDDVPNIEVGVEVPGSLAGLGYVKRSKLPGGDVAYAVHHGPHEDLPEVHQAVRDWCDAKRLVVAGPHWEIHGHVRGDAEPETTVYWLLS